MAALEGPFEHGAKELFVRAIVGVATSASSGQRADDLLRDADVSMYTAKSNGKNRVEVFAPSMHEAALARLALKGDLERASARGEFDPVYQPIMDLRTNRISGVEALVRWNHPRRGLVGPTDFIAVAEETGLIVPLGRWIMERARRQAIAWQDGTSGRLTMRVNLSARQIQEPAFVQEVADVLAATGLAPERLTLELTESVLMQDVDTTAITLNSLRALGIRLAIDDFGTGFSSLSYLRRFPIDELKIDRSFVTAMNTGPDESALVRSILKLGETLHLETVAEGIEQADQLAELRTLGADLGQGYFFAMPLSPGDLSAYVARDDAEDDPIETGAA